MWHLCKFDSGNLAEAQQLFRLAIDLDPEFAQTYSAMGFSHFVELTNFGTKFPLETLQKAMGFASQAVALDDKDALAHFMLGRILTMRGEYDAGIAESRIAINLSPSLAMGHYGLGVALWWKEQSAEALSALDTAIRLSPRDPFIWAVLNMRAFAHNYFGNYDLAVEDAQRAVRHPAASFWPHSTLTSSLGHLGRREDAKIALENLLEVRVRPETLCRITEFSEHESNGRELDEGERVAVEVLPVLGQSAAAVEPGDGAFDHPTPGLDDEALHPIGSLDDLGLEIGQDAGQGAVKDRPLIGAVGEQFPEKGKQTEQGRQQRETAVAILNVGGGDDAVPQQALRIDQNMPLLALDQLAGIEAVAVDASPPFSALFTL